MDALNFVWKEISENFILLLWFGLMIFWQWKKKGKHGAVTMMVTSIILFAGFVYGDSLAPIGSLFVIIGMMSAEGISMVLVKRKMPHDLTIVVTVCIASLLLLVSSIGIYEVFVVFVCLGTGFVGNAVLHGYLKLASSVWPIKPPPMPPH